MHIHTRHITTPPPVRTVHPPNGAQGRAPQPLLIAQGEDDGPRGDENEEPGGEIGVLGEVPQL